MSRAAAIRSPAGSACRGPEAMLHGLRTALGKGNKRSGPVLPLVHPNLSGQTNNRLHRHLLDDEEPVPPEGRFKLI